MTNYNNGKIYKLEPICEYEEGDIYIGSTTKEYLCQRLATHKRDYKQWKQKLCNKIMSYELFDKYGIDNIKIVLLELVNVNSKDELISKESEYIKNNKCVNKIIPNRTREEWRNDNKEKINEYKKEWREDNKEKLVEYRKEYRSKNKDKINIYKKKYREENKEKINAKVICVCGVECNRKSLSRHTKTKAHNEYIKNQAV